VTTHIQNRHRVARIGRLLIDGPFSIKPPESLDDYGWLECDLRVTHWAADAVHSAAIYVDDSMNRDADFLPPLLRYVEWNRAADLRAASEGAIQWPTATVTLSYIDQARDEIDALIRRLQTRLGSLPFSVFGLSVDRSIPAVPSDHRGRISLYSRNGIQSVEFHAPTSDRDAGLSDDMLAAVRALQGLRRPFRLGEGWRESYPYPLDASELGPSHWWDYRKPPINVASA
jgi:hypothetical protein